MNAAYWIDRLQMKKHVEGGWYCEIYRSPVELDPANNTFIHAPRSLCTHIYFLLEHDDFSALHRIGADELWHFYDGDALTIYEIDLEGKLTEHLLGNDAATNAAPFTLIQKGSWFGSRVVNDGSYTLVGCTVIPGFDFADFELGKADELRRQFPAYTTLINSMCRV